MSFQSIAILIVSIFCGMTVGSYIEHLIFPQGSFAVYALVAVLTMVGMQYLGERAFQRNFFTKPKK